MRHYAVTCSIVFGLVLMVCAQAASGQIAGERLAIESVMRDLQARREYFGFGPPSWPGLSSECGCSISPPDYPPDGFYGELDGCCAVPLVASLESALSSLYGSFVKQQYWNLEGFSSRPDPLEYESLAELYGSTPGTLDCSNYRDRFDMIRRAIDKLRVVEGVWSYGTKEYKRFGAYSGPGPGTGCDCDEAIDSWISAVEAVPSFDQWDSWVAYTGTVDAGATVAQSASNRTDTGCPQCDPPNDVWTHSFNAELLAQRCTFTSDLASKPGTGTLYVMAIQTGQDGLVYAPPFAVDEKYHAFEQVTGDQSWESGWLGPESVSSPMSHTDACGQAPVTNCDTNEPPGISVVKGWLAILWEEEVDRTPILLFRPTFSSSTDDDDSCDDLEDPTVDPGINEPGETKEKEECEGGSGGGEGGSGSGAGVAGDGQDNAEIVWPVDLTTGNKLEHATDVNVSLIGEDFRFTRSYTSNPEYSGASLIGNGWMANCFKFVRVGTDGSDLIVQMAGPPMNREITFVPDGTNRWAAGGSTSQYLMQAQTTVDSIAYDVWRLIEPGQWEMDFYSEDGAHPGNSPDELEGLPLERRDAYGNRRLYEYDTYGPASGSKQPRLRTVYLNGDSEADCEAMVRFTWLLGGFNIGKLGYLQVFRFDDAGIPVETQRVDYRYKRDGDGLSADLGTDGDLIEVRHRVAVDRAPTGVEKERLRVTQYRYHDNSAAGSDSDERLNASGRAGQLKARFDPEQIEFVAQQVNVSLNDPVGDELRLAADDLLTLADNAVAYSDDASNDVLVIDLAAKIVSYTSALDGSRVDHQYIQTACGCGGGATQGLMIDLDYFVTGVDNPTTKVTEHVYDGADWDAVHRYIYYDMERLGPDDVSYLVNTAIVEPGGSGRRWVTHKVYDTDRNLTRLFTPSAVEDYTAVDETGGLDITLRSNDGLVYEYQYTADHRRKEIAVRQGDTGGVAVVQRTNYPTSASASPAKRLWLPESIQRFRVAGDTTTANNIETTSFTYGFYTSSTTSSDLAWVKTAVEAELQAENGPDSPTTYDSYELYDEDGLNVWSAAEDLTLTFRDFDTGTGAVTQITRNADPDGSGDADALPGTWASGGNSLSTSGWGPHAADGELTTTYVHDELGRVIQRVSPGGVNSYTVREMREIESRPGVLYYATISLPHRLAGATAGEKDEFDGPAVVTWMNAGNDTIGVSEYTVDGTETYTPTPAGSFIFSFETTTGDVADPRGEIARSRVVHTVSGLVSARQVWENITGGQGESMYEDTYEYDALGRLSQMTNANGTITKYSVYDVLNRVLEVKVGTDSTNLKTVGQYFYDDSNPNDGTDAQGVGDGNLNVIVLSTGDDGTLTAATRKTKRFFDFRDRLVTTVNPLAPHEALAYDNLGRVVERAIITTAPASVTAAVDPSDETDRGLYSQTGYSQRGLRFLQRVAIDPSEADPGAGSGYLESHSWYDARGRTIASWMPNSPGTKRVYDAHSRTTAMYVTDRGGDAAPGASGNHAAAAAVTGDTVLEQVEYDYTDDDLVELVTSNYRNHDATSTGALSSSNAVTTYVGFVYDDADRRTHTVNYGTRSASNLFEAGGSAPTVPSSIPSSWWTNGTYDDQIITGAAYNRRGLVEDSIDGEGRTTRVLYDDLSRRIAVIENWKNATIAWATDRWQASDIAQNGTAGGNDERGTDRVTSFLYDGSSHVTHQVAHLWDGTTSTGANDKVQITQYFYDSTTETTPDPSDLTENLVPSKDLLKEVRYPDESTGEAGTTNALKVRYAYNHLGELRSVIDQNGTTHGYVRDELGRVEQDEVTAFGTNIDQAVKSISVTYDSLSRLDKVRSWDGTDLGTAGVTNAVQFTYTPLWQVNEVKQDVDSDIAGGGIATATLDYDYVNAAVGSGNFSRLSGMDYPAGGTYAPDYGTASSLDDVISRAGGLGISGGLAFEYQYVGLGMVAILDYTDADVQLDRTYTKDGARRYGSYTDQAAGVYPGWNRFGRVQRQAWVDGALTVHASDPDVPNVPPILDQSYTYDRASNRETNIDERPGARIAYRDFQYVYDGLDRLIESRRGAWTGGAITPYGPGSANPDLAKLAGQQWDYDLLGNWIEFRANLDGSTESTNDDRYTGTGDLDEDRTHNAANELTELTRDGGTTDLPFTYDDSGNMRVRYLDASILHVYTHDAWNRLVRVGAGTLQQVQTGDEEAIGEYEYNGLHWRTVKRADADDADLGVDQQRIMYYDASWRLIEERIDDAFDGTHSDTRQAQQFWGLRYIDDAVIRRVRAWVNTAAPEDPPNFEWTDWEHFWYVTDVQFSVMALLDEAANVVERVSYDAYGNARHRRPADLDGDGDVDTPDLSAYPSSNDYFIGESGYSADFDLNRDGSEDDINDFLNYLDWWFPGNGTAALPDGEISETDAGAFPTAGSAVAPDNPIGYCGYAFNPETRLYLARNRWYSPELGRWLERDPAGYVDGMSRYEYVRGSPGFTDPLGLQVAMEQIPPGGDSSSSCECHASFLDHVEGALGDKVPAIDAIGIAQATAFTDLCGSDQDLLRLFDSTQSCILQGISACSSCVDKDEQAEAQKWIEDTVRDFMRPYVESLRQRAAGDFIVDDGWRNFFDRVDKGDFTGRYLVPAACEHVLTLGLSALTWESWFDEDDFLWYAEHRVAYEMALNHINNDLRRALQNNGVGDDAVWSCIGDVVSNCQRANQNAAENIGAAWARSWLASMDVGEIRDRMRKEVQREQAGGGKQ